MSFTQKYEKALREIQDCGLMSIVQLRWLDNSFHRFGLPIRPLHYRPVLQLFVQQTLLFGILVSLTNCIWLKNIFGFSLPLPFLPLMFVTYGLLFATFFCAQAENERDACTLSRWEDL